MARRYAGYIAPLKGLTRKCVVVDLDNTLWGGVVGEDGPRGIHLGDTAPGVEYQDFQRYLAALSARGVLLAVNSKNNPEDALEVIRSHEGMVLREAAFSAVRVNWRPKPENMVSIAEELSLGLDALVFLDDSPEERALMRDSLPQVLTPEMPTDPALYRQTVEALPQLQSLVVTETDLTRVEQYRARRQREQARDGATSVEEFLHSLEITLQIAPADDSTLARVHQLFQRTNQFNLTTRRHGLEQLTAWARDPGWRLYTVRSRDRFGDHGLVAVALVRLDPATWVIDSFVMSCRVISYGVETALLATVCEAATSAGAGTVIGEFVETRKNLPARDFYARHGFAADGSADGVTRWTLALPGGAVQRPAWVALEVAPGS
jgi:FkbH-like protein